MNDDTNQFAGLVEVVAALRAPDGCPWDRKQTPETMRSHILEESYECIEAIGSRDPSHVREELGDLMMLLVMVARMYEEIDEFSIHDVIREVNEKLVRRHPHVFGDATVRDADEVVSQWKTIKVEQEGKEPDRSILSSVSKGLPPLERSHKLQRAAAKVGFDWPDLSGVFAKIMEEIDEVKTAVLESQAAEPPHQEIEDEIGDLIFSTVNLARYLRVDPAVALHRTNTKFLERFASVERAVAASGKRLEECTLEELERHWQSAKKPTKHSNR